MRKAILLFGNYPPPFGGVPTHIKYLTDHLVAREWDVHILSFAGRQTGVERQSGYTIYRPTQFSRSLYLLRSLSTLLKRLTQFKELAFSDPKLFLGLVGTANLIKEIVLKHNIQVISAYHVLTAGISSAWVAEELSLPLITTVFGEIYAHPELHRKRIKEVEYVLNQSSQVLSCSNHCAQSFKVLGITPQVETLYYGIDVEQFSLINDSGIVRTKLGIAATDPVVIFVGRMVEELGLHILLESIPQVLQSNPNIKFIIAGTTGDLTERARALQASHLNHIFVVPDVPSAELSAYYSAATLAVAPSINSRACLGLALAEAMATGKPTIGADVGGTAEVLVHNETGLLVKPEDPKALAEAILYLLGDVKLMEQFGQQGRKRAEQIFDKELANQQMEQILHTALANGPTRQFSPS